MSEYTTTPNYGLYKPNYDSDEEMWGTHLNLNADAIDTALHTIEAGGPYLPLAGGTMAGPIVLGAAPTLANQVANKGYVDGFLPLAGGTVSGVTNFTGIVNVTGTCAVPTPTLAGHATNKSYVDGKFLPLNGGGSLPTSPSGQPAGTFWNNGGVVCIV